ncbi:hypothetical protein [Actinomyces qiguomingii]|uniref:hypothetical protein n=1 Tax=Actinomyces qiguomingii TaxID=2057800 RepID=UPI000CA055AE|nr:hypothetical protein [Actinomyces qiguomingii]
MAHTRQDISASGTAARVDRLAAAREALVHAEERAGLRGREAGQVASAVADAERSSHVVGATALAAAVPVPETGETPIDSLLPVGADAAGVVVLTGSVGALLVLAALRQGGTEWCGIIGYEGLGWCAAAEAGLDLARVLAVPAADLPPNLLTASLGALLDGVSVLLISSAAASCLHPRDRRTLLARARERRCLILTPFAWEGARVLTASPLHPQARGDFASDVIPLRNRTQEDNGVREFEGGYLQHLAWTLCSPHRPERVRLLLDAAGAHLSPEVPQVPAVPEPVSAPGPHLVLVNGSGARRQQEETA